MPIDRRSTLRLAGLGVGATLAGCIDLGVGSEDGTPTDDPDGSNGSVAVEDVETTPFTLRSARPPWHESDAVGEVVVVDSLGRQRDLFGAYDLSEDRTDDLWTFLGDVDYATERVFVVESAGPNGCHDAFGVDAVRVEEDRIHADASVLDSASEATECTQAVVYPSVLVRVSFEDHPVGTDTVDEVAVDVTDGWDETATVTAHPDDPLPSPNPADLSGYVRPDPDPDPVPPLDCEREAVKRHSQWYDESAVQWGDFERDGETVLSLRVDELSHERGETARFTLTNVTDDSVHTGNRHKYNLQVYTEDGWQDVRVKDEDGHFAYTDEAVGHPIGGGFEWSVELTEDGVVADTYHDDAEVCPGLQSGRYRFAYFGVIGDGAVAVAFDLTA